MERAGSGRTPRPLRKISVVAKHSIRRKRKTQRELWALARVCETCPSAARVWVALQDSAIERGSPVLTPTRESLAQATGIRRLQTISDALTALTKASWLDRIHVPVVEGGLQTATLLRLVLRRGTLQYPRSKRKTLHTAKSPVGNEKRCTAKQRKTLHS